VRRSQPLQGDRTLVRARIGAHGLVDQVGLTDDPAQPSVLVDDRERRDPDMCQTLQRRLDTRVRG
jgi:hypothetical protein